jgi:hypothetical protein
MPPLLMMVLTAVAPLAVPPETMNSSAPAPLTTVPLASAPGLSTSSPPLLTCAPFTTPPACTASMPPLKIVVLTAVPNT